MDKQATFEQTPAYDQVNDLLTTPDPAHPRGEDIIDGSLLEDVESLDEFAVEVKDDGRLKYSVPTAEDDSRHLFVVVTFEQGAVEEVEMDVGQVAGKLAGRGYNWRLNADGDITTEGSWLA